MAVGVRSNHDEQAKRIVHIEGDWRECGVEVEGKNLPVHSCEIDSSAGEVTTVEIVSAIHEGEETVVEGFLEVLRGERQDEIVPLRVEFGKTGHHSRVFVDGDELYCVSARVKFIARQEPLVWLSLAPRVVEGKAGIPVMEGVLKERRNG